MSEKHCLSCVALQAKIVIQQQQIALLNRKVANLEKKIAIARETAHVLINSANKTMANHCPRGTWAMAKGQRAAAVEIDGCLM